MSWSLILGSNLHTCLHLSDSVCLIVVIPVEDIIQHYSTNSSIICTMFETKMKSGHFLPICLMQVRIIWKLFRCDFFCPRLPPAGSAAGCLIVSGRRRGKYFDTGDRGAAYSQRRQAGAALTAFVWTPANCGRNDGMSWYEERRPKVQQPDNPECRVLSDGHSGMLARSPLLANPEMLEQKSHLYF